MAIATDAPSIGRETGIVCFANSAHGAVDLIADPMFALDAAVAEVPASPVRLLDTRVAGGQVAPLEQRCFAAAAGTPPGAAVFVNLTPVLATAPGSGQLVSSDLIDVPVASNVNFAPGKTDPNVAVARVGVDGDVCFRNNSPRAAVDIVADQLATLAPGGSWGSLGDAPARVVDTRLDGSRLAPAERRCFGGVGAPGDIALVNLTPVLASSAGHGVLVTSDATEVPVASNVNFAPGTIDPNVASARVGPDGTICFVNSAHADVDLVVDFMMTIDRAAARSVSSGRFDTRVVAPVGEVCTDEVCLARVERQLLALRSTDGGGSWSHLTLPGQERPLASLVCSATICRARSEALSSSPAAGELGAAAWFTADVGVTWHSIPDSTTSVACSTATTCLAVGEWRGTYGLSYTPWVSVSVDGGDTWTAVDVTSVDPPLEPWVADLGCAQDCPVKRPLFGELSCLTERHCVAAYDETGRVDFTTDDGWATVDIEHTPIDG